MLYVLSISGKSSSLINERNFDFFRVNKNEQSGIIDLEFNFIIPMGEKIKTVEWVKKEYLWIVRDKVIEIYKTTDFK